MPIFVHVQVDEFLVEAVTVRKIKKIRIGHDGSGGGDGWFLDKVVVRQVDKPDTETLFECGRWLDTNEDDGLIVREITSGGSQMLSSKSLTRAGHGSCIDTHILLISEIVAIREISAFGLV